MIREKLLLERVRAWVEAGRIPARDRWLESHGLAVLLPDLYGEERAKYWRRQTLAANVLLLDAAARIVTDLRREQIGVAVLKGVDLLERLYAGREADRRTSDVDLLVDDRRMDSALDAVERLGYSHAAQETRQAQKRWSKDVTFEGTNGVRVEVHQRISIEAGLTSTWEDLRSGGHLEEGRGLAGADRLTLEALAVHLLVHLAIHRFGGDSLRWVLDILVLLDRHGEALDRDRLVAVAKRLGSRRAAGAAVRAISRLVPEADLGALAALPEGGARERLALWLVDPVRATLEGGAGWTKPRSLLSRLLLEENLFTAGAFVVRKFHIVRSRNPRRRTDGARGQRR